MIICVMPAGCDFAGTDVITTDIPWQDPVVSLASLGAPTADIEQMLAEIEQGR